MNGGEVKSVFCVYVCPRVAQITPVERGIPAGIQRRVFHLTLVVISFRVFFGSTVRLRGLHVKCWYNTTAHTHSESPASWRCQRDGGGLSKLSTDGHTKGARAETHGGSSRCAQAAQHALRAACRAFAHTTQLRHNWPKCPNVAYVRT